MQPKGYVYILTTASNTTLYTGVSSNLQQRIPEHKNRTHPESFSARYNCTKLVYVNELFDISAAIKEEKRIKAGNRKQKIALINSINPEWKDLWDDVNRYS